MLIIPRAKLSSWAKWRVSTLPYEKLKQQGLITFSYINKYVQWATSSEQWHPALWSPEKFLPRPSGSAKQRGWGKPWCSSPQWKPSLSHAEESSHLALPWKTTQEGLLSPSLQTDVSMRAQFQHFRVCSPADTKRMMDSLNGLRCQAGLDPCGDVATSISQAKVSFVRKSDSHSSIFKAWSQRQSDGCCVLCMSISDDKVPKGPCGHSGKSSNV